MAAEFDPEQPSNITHRYDESFVQHPALRKYAEAAARFLDEDTDDGFHATATWSVNAKSQEATAEGRAADGPIAVSLRDDDLGVTARGNLRLRDIDDDFKFWVRSLWMKLLSARTAELHRLAFNSGDRGDGTE